MRLFHAVARDFLRYITYEATDFARKEVHGLMLKCPTLHLQGETVI